MSVPHPVEDMFLINEWYWKSTEYFGKFTGKSKPGNEVFTGNPGWNLLQVLSGNPYLHLKNN